MIALEITDSSDFSSGIHIVKEQDFPASYQMGYQVAQGVEFSAVKGFCTGIEGTVARVKASVVNDGAVYRGFVALGGRIHAGYIHPAALFNLIRPGISGTVTAQFARYSGTTLLFFFMSVAVSPSASFQLSDGVSCRLSLPVSYSFRRELLFHISFGLSAAFLIG